MIFLFILSCFVMALVYAASFAVYRRNGPSLIIGRFSYMAVIVYGLHLGLALIALASFALQSRWPLVAASVVIAVSPFIIAAIFSFRQATLAISLQILVLTGGGLCLTMLV